MEKEKIYFIVKAFRDAKGTCYWEPPAKTYVSPFLKYRMPKPLRAWTNKA